MQKKLRELYLNNKLIVWAAAVSVVLALGVLLKVKDEVTRFTLIMPIFAGFILFAILITPDEELEDEQPQATKSTPVYHKRTRKSR